MKLALLLTLPASLISAVCAAAIQSSDREYSEHLHLKPLPGGSLYAGFNFTSQTLLSTYENQHFRYFPRSLAQILQHSHTEELHLRFALGRWDEENWGSRPRDGRREGGTGVELWAWVDAGGEPGKVLEERWDTLVNSLSGLFCASLNFIDETKTTRPVLSFEPEGTFKEGGSTLKLFHGTLPHEVVCTENLTPMLKLLPCKGKAGISSLLDGHKIFDANWQTMSIDVRPICYGGNDCVVEIQQTIDMVLDIQRSMRPRDSPIPRPPPVEEIQCDYSKPYNAADTCYPDERHGELTWSLSKVFGQAVKGSCHLDDSHGEDFIDITLDVDQGRDVEILLDESVRQERSASGLSRLFKLGERDFDISLPQQVMTVSGEELPVPLGDPPLHAGRQMTGYGQERGGMHATIRNPRPYSQRFVYLESLPWFLRPYMHTLKVDGAKLEKMYYTPALDRKRGTQLELLLEVPAESTVELSYDFEKAILRYTEYPPDANRGFDVAPAILRVLASNGEQDSYLRTTSLLLPLPTPDFSMPYNVIILTSTVIALGFGSIFNLLVRRFVLVEEVPVSPLVLRIRAVAARIRGMVQTRAGSGAKTSNRPENAPGTTQGEGSAGGTANGRPKVANGDQGHERRKDK